MKNDSYLQGKEWSSSSLKRGFSLIELLVTIGIIAILSVIILAGLGGHRDKKDVEGATAFLAAQLRELQTSALTGQQYTANTTPCGYRGTWSGSTVIARYLYKDGSGNCAQNTIISTMTLPAGVTAASASSVDFTLPHGKVASDMVITLQKGSASAVVCLGTDGVIETQLLAASC